MKKLLASLAFIAAFLSTDLHWSVMQTVTWAHMIQQSESTVSFGQKVVSTITGQAPCDHCSALAEEKNSERNEVLSLVGKGPMLAPLGGSLFQLSHLDFSLFRLMDHPGGDNQIFPEGLEPPPRA